MSNYKKSKIYQMGKHYQQFGEMLMNPNTTVSEMVDFHHASGLSVLFSVVDDRPEQNHDKKEDFFTSAVHPEDDSPKYSKLIRYSDHE